MKRRNSIIWGIVLVALGVIFALNALGIADVSLFFDGWWTLFIIIPCLSGLFTSRDKTGSIIGLLIGVALLLACQGLFDFDMIWRMAIPVIIVVIGINMIFRGVRKNESVKLTEEINKRGVPLKECCATFSGQKADYTGENFEGASLTAVFGGIECDLRGAVIEKDAVINACCVFGGIDILVPDGINVKTNSVSIFGGISDEKHKNSAECKATLYINGTCIFGGVDVK